MPPALPTLRNIQVAASAILSGVVVMTIVPLILRTSGVMPPGGTLDGPEMAPMIEFAMLGAGMAMVLMSFVMRSILSRKEQQGHLKEADAGRLLIPLALAESPATLGLAMAILTGNTLYPLILSGLSLGAAIFHFPTRAMLEKE